MARILRGKRDGERVKIERWRADGFVCDTDDGIEIIHTTNLELSIPEMEEILEQNKNGLLLELYEPTKNFSFKKRKKH